MASSTSTGPGSVANVPSGTVLVTGASSGIGEATSLHLRELGFDSVAAVRKDDDAERLATSGLRTVRMDVTDIDSIAAARAELGDGPLAGLVNNAGIAVAAPLEFLPLDQLRHQLEVNLIGQVAVTQRFLPALRAAGAYHASKFALEAISDTLRRELLSQGVDVIVIEPGGVKTPIWRKGGELAAELTSDLPPEGKRLYGPLIAAIRKETAKIASDTGIEPREVAEAIGRALTARRPRARYLVGRDAKLRAPAAAVLPARVMDRIVARMLGV